MQITIVKVGPELNKGKYQEFEAVYKKDDKVEGKKFLSFKYPDVYKALLASKEGDVFEVTTAKENGYWQWTALQGAGQVATEKTEEKTVNKPTGRVTGSNYETPEERAARQRFIVRQSSLTTALDYLKHNNPKGAIDYGEWTKLAKALETYVS